MPHPVFHSEFLQNAVSFSNQRLQLHPIELAVSIAVCLRDPNSSEATVGISELVRVCVLRYDVFELFGVGVQDEQALNYLWISVPGMKSMNYLGVCVRGGLYPEGWASEQFMYLQMRMFLRGRLDGPPLSWVLEVDL